MRRLRAAAWALIALAMGACGGGDLSRDTVTNLPAGNAQGSALSGRYDLTLRTTSCGGLCPTIQVSIFTIHLCREGDVNHQNVSATQNGGELAVNGDAGLYVDALRGGVWDDGAFDIGGYADVQGVAVTARVDGTLHADGTIDARARVRGVGTVSATEVNCNGTYAVTGSRQ